MSDDEGGGGGRYEEVMPEMDDEFFERDEEEEHDFEKEQMEFFNAPENELDFSEETTKNRVTTRFLTKYERARIIGTRAIQISLNAPIMVELEGEIDPVEIAQKELRERKIPFIIRRYLPNGSHEDWKVEELIID
eukprot:TRINITY_DN131_c0_g1_i1.p1 TRINITY_DN131_c0_g1~~TRINITY_DN131_c0_g1_i1.p1  ORF type:complete len:135 (-),score=34.70 TRINITY_DN131_c0_g1_i1:371-775(-)